MGKELQRREDSSDYYGTGERGMVRQEEEEEDGEKLPSKNSEFMGRAGKDKVGK